MLIYVAHRISRPIHQLTAGLSQLAAGDLNARVATEAGRRNRRRHQAFNNMAGKLQESTERLVYLRQVASWQTLARKMAHEVKNSLTPIRLTVEEIAARKTDTDRQFMNQAMQIVVDEIETLERRVRAFSQFASRTLAASLRAGHQQLRRRANRIPQSRPPQSDIRVRLAEGMPSASPTRIR